MGFFYIIFYLSSSEETDDETETEVEEVKHQRTIGPEDYSVFQVFFLLVCVSVCLSFLVGNLFFCKKNYLYLYQCWMLLNQINQIFQTK